MVETVGSHKDSGFCLQDLKSWQGLSGGVVSPSLLWEFPTVCNRALAAVPLTFRGSFWRIFCTTIASLALATVLSFCALEVILEWPSLRWSYEGVLRHRD